MPRENRPIDPAWRVPIPLVAEQPDGTVKFGVINEERAGALAAARRCAVCGDRMGERVAFIAGEDQAADGLFGQPPMCEACARAALVLCPFLAPGPSGRWAPAAEDSPLVAVRPTSDWFLCLCRSYIVLTARRFGVAFGSAPRDVHLFRGNDPEPIIERYAYTASGRLERAPG